MTSAWRNRTAKAKPTRHSSRVCGRNCCWSCSLLCRWASLHQNVARETSQSPSAVSWKRFPKNHAVMPIIPWFPHNVTPNFWRSLTYGYMVLICIGHLDKPRFKKGVRPFGQKHFFPVNGEMGAWKWGHQGRLEQELTNASRGGLKGKLEGNGKKSPTQVYLVKLVCQPFLCYQVNTKVCLHTCVFGWTWHVSLNLVLCTARVI